MENQPLPDSVPTLLVDETVLQSQPRISTSVPNSLTLFQETYKNEICHSEAFKNSSGHARTFEVVYEDPSNSDTAIKVPTFPEFTSTSLGVLNSGPLVTEANAVRIGLNQPQILFLTPESILGETTFNSLSNDLSSVMNATNFIDQTQVSMPDKMFHNRESLCRICASDTEKTLPLFRNDVLSQNLVRKIHRCLPIKILGSDDLPQQICEECAAKLQTSDEFVSLCLAGNTKLKEIAWMWSKLEGDSKKCEQDKEATSDDFGILQESTTTKESLLQSQSLQLEFVIKDKPKIVEELDLELCSPDNQDKETNQHSLGLEGKSIEDHTPVPHIPGNKDTQLNSTSMHDSKSLKISELEKRQWNCSECDYKASRQSSLSMHKQQKHAMDATESEQSLNEDIKDDSAKFVCQYCHRYFLSETKWENHLNSHLKVASYTNAKLLKCKLCNREFPNSRYLNKHLKTVHSVNQDIKHKCDICGKAYRLASSLDIHLATHSNETPCLCDVCGKSFKHPSNLRCHKRSHAEEKLTHPHSCDTCGKSFRSKFHLSEHKNVHLNITPYSCSICGKMFHRRIQLRQHRKIHDKGSSFECPKCGVCFNRRGNMTEHMKRHLKEREFNCKVCKVSYKTLSEVVHHRKEHKEQDLADPVNGVERFLCTHCNKLFSSSKELKDHFKDHLNVKFECEICNKQLSNRRSLDYHMKSFHTLERPYPCHHCSESFLSRDARIVHERLHTGEKPYTCSECEMGFRCSSNLAQHMSTHRDLRPWSCEVCPKSFKRKGILSVHMRTHTGEKPFCCDICGRRFTQKNDMLKHQHTHTSAKQAFLCVDCNWAFNTRKELNKHRKNLHSHSGAQSGTNIASTLPPHSQALLITNEVCQFPITILEEGSNVIVHQIEELGKHPQIIELNTSDSNSQILHFTDSLLQTVVPDSQILSVQDTSCQPATNFASDIAQSVLPPSTEQNWLASQQK